MNKFLIVLVAISIAIAVYAVILNFNNRSEISAVLAKLDKLISTQDSIVAAKQAKLESIKNGRQNREAAENDAYKAVELIRHGSGYSDATGIMLPRISMKFKNISGRTLKESIEVEAVFYDIKKGEEIGRATHYLHKRWESPMGVDNVIQFYLTSQRGWSISSIDHEVEVEIFINQVLLKRVKVDKRIVEDWFL